MSAREEERSNPETLEENQQAGTAAGSAQDLNHEPGQPDQKDQEQQPETEQTETDQADMVNRLAEKDSLIKDLSDKYMRLAAEYDNFRRRSKQEKEALYSETIADVVRHWLPVLDNLDRAEFVSTQYEHEDTRQVCEGITMVQSQVREVLAQLGVSEIESLDQPFDPELHDAVMHVEDEQYGPSTVVEVLRKGYRLKDRVIRHAMVKVAN